MKITYQTTDAPIKQIDVTNGAKHYDLVLSKAKHGRTVRIADKYNTNRVQITLNEVDDLIDALKLVRDQGVETSVESLSFAA